MAQGKENLASPLLFCHETCYFLFGLVLLCFVWSLIFHTGQLKYGTIHTRSQTRITFKATGCLQIPEVKFRETNVPTLYSLWDGRQELPSFLKHYCVSLFPDFIFQLCAKCNSCKCACHITSLYWCKWSLEGSLWRSHWCHWVESRMWALESIVFNAGKPRPSSGHHDDDSRLAQGTRQMSWGRQTDGNRW